MDIDFQILKLLEELCGSELDDRQKFDRLEGVRLYMVALQYRLKMSMNDELNRIGR
jgi:hypothetical protein